jgi:phosphopantetheinyl transferase
LTYGLNGKPYLKNQSINFNISHSGDYVVLATANREIGVDIEKIAVYPDKVAIRCFTLPEREWMEQEGENEAFYRLWTAKESVMKASGLGFSLAPEIFSVLPMDASAHHIDKIGKTWFLDWIPYNDYIICLAIEGKREKAEVITITPDDLLIA